MFCPVAANEENLYSYPGELIGAARHYGGGGGGTVTLAPQFVGPVGQLADYDELKIKHDWFNQSTSRTVMSTGDSTKENWHHFDNPVYTTYKPSSPLANIEPLNNVRLNNRLNNKNKLVEQERAAATAHYLEEDDNSDCTSEGTRLPLSYEDKHVYIFYR